MKLRISEAGRAEDAQAIRELRARLTDYEAFLVYKPKLQAKLQSLQSEVATYKREIADMKVDHEAFETRLQDQTEQLEMAMLDREVAEERAEGAEADLEVQKELRAEKEVELNVLKEQLERTSASDGGDTVAGEEGSAKSSLDYIQLEKQNERLKEALIRYVFLPEFGLLSSDVVPLIVCVTLHTRLRLRIDGRLQTLNMNSTRRMRCNVGQF